MNRLLIAFFLFLAGCLVAAYGFAAGGASPLLPGGAALGFWRCDGGSTTEVVVENVRDYAVAVHLVVYDSRSQEVMDFTVPLSEHDIWGGTLSCDGNQISIRAWASHFDHDTPVYWAPMPAQPFGFLTVAITSLDTSDRILATLNPIGTWSLNWQACDPGNQGLPCNNGDPRDDFNWTHQSVKLPNAIILRTMFVSPSSGRAIALNGVMLQDFVNLGGQFDNDDENGIKVSMAELLAFNVRNGGTIQSDGGRVALGSYDGIYFFPYVNENGFTTRFWLMIPFSGQPHGTEVELYVCSDDTCNCEPSWGRYHIEDVIFPPPLQPQGRALLEVVVQNNHQVSSLGFSPQPLPLFGISFIESPSSSGFYYATWFNRTTCVDTRAGITCIHEGN